MKTLLTGLWVIARTTYGETTRRPVYYIVLLSFCSLILLSQSITLFSFHQEQNMIREMGVASMPLWSLIILLVVGGLTVTNELEDRTALVMLSKPISRTTFLLGKYFGILSSLVTGMLFLALALFLTLWLGFGIQAFESVYSNKAAINEILSDRMSMFDYAWDTFLSKNLIIVFGGLLMSILQVMVLVAFCVAFSAFLPSVVTITATIFLFVLGNISAYVVGSVQQLDIESLSMGVQAAAYLLPNLGYFNLQSHFSEGRMISLSYMLQSSLYAALYAGAVMFLASSLFERREIR